MPVPTLVCASCPLTPKQRQTFETVQRIWLEHVFWTRFFIVSDVGSLPDLSAVTNRLLRNPTDFADVLRPLYGPDRAVRFESLLRDHLVIASKLVNAAKAGNTATADEERKLWYSNADEIALFLNNINPNWSKKVWQDLLYDHLNMTENEAIYQIRGEYEESVAEFDKIQKEALQMANYMAGGIIKQFKV